MEPVMTGEEFLDKMIRSGVATLDTILGCAEDEIREIEVRQNVRVPATYRQWLRLAGKCAGVFGCANSCYPELLATKKAAENLMKTVERGRVTLPDESFVCGMASPEEFVFFRCEDQTQDPPLTLYHVDFGGFRHHGTFWGMMVADLDSWAECLTGYAMEYEFAKARDRCRRLKEVSR